jgi:hypothetical protein
MVDAPNLGSGTKSHDRLIAQTRIPRRRLRNLYDDGLSWALMQVQLAALKAPTKFKRLSRLRYFVLFVNRYPKQYFFNLRTDWQHFQQRLGGLRF